jgi:RHS repeat-associated protein
MKDFPFTPCLVFAALAWAFIASPLSAQIGGQNPAGASGIFNGQVTTGCSYDPYTGNATRSITDIAVAGSVGEYPLALVRTANSRTPSMTGVFGWDGGWNHNYNWTVEDSPVAHTQNFPPVKYTVNFPDGRVQTFRAVTWDSVYRVRPGADIPPQSTSAGIRERFLQLNLNNLYAYLILPDGGAVEFRAQQNYDPAYGRYWYTYRVTGIYDPHGLKTTIDSQVVGTIRRITRVTEPSGRYLQFSYDPNARRRITQIQEYINGVPKRRVQYNYNGLGWLTSVVYYDNPTWTATYQYMGSNIGGNLPFLLYTCDDPMYLGPMHKIAYTYRTTDNYTGNHPGYGQVSSENYYDGTNVGAAVSTLTVPSATTRIEMRGDTKTRTFTYTTAGYLTTCTDFMNHSASQGYDDKMYVNYVADRNNHRTDYTNDPITGNVTQIQFPLTPGDTPGQGNTRPTVNYAYTNAYYLHTVQDEAGNLITISLDPSHNRVTRIDYPDGGYETFGYDAAHLYQLQSHRMLTGGTETWTYDARHRKDTYRNPDSPSPSPSPSAHFYYDSLDRVSGIADALNHSTNFDYNDRGQVTVTKLPWISGVRYTISNLYNADGTLQRRTDELGHITSYGYDDYRRLKSVTPPLRGAGDNGIYTTNFYYDANGAVDDYRFTDSNVTWIKPPSEKKTKIVYDGNRRKTSVTIGHGTGNDATTEYGYDYVGNLRTISNPQPGRVNLTINYDERNRPYQVILGPSQTATISYDAAGRRKTVQRPNGQTITYDTFDAMNRVTQLTVIQTPDPDAVTKFTYYTTTDGPNAPVGLLKTMKDPRLVQLNNGQAYTYEYDLMGRKKKITYPKDSTNSNRTEQWAYDTVGRLDTFTNRANKVQTFSHDQLNRMTGFTWNDGGVTPSVSFGYDEASRLIEIDNANANISRTYYNDNLLHMETQSLSAVGGLANRHVTYTYDEDGNRASLAIPGYTFDYRYTGRNQVRFINDDATGLTQAYYEYDLVGNVTLRNANTSPVTASNYGYDAYARVTSVSHTLNGITRTFNYGYDTYSNNRLWAKRGIAPTSSENNKGEAFSYDLGDQAIAFQLNVANPQNMPQPLPRNIVYDSNGNRTSFQGVQYGATNNLNQYITRTVGGNTTTAAYDIKGSITTALDNSTYVYDSQNRLLRATKNGVTMSFEYDGLNRQVSRTASGAKTYNTWDGWDLVEEYTNNPLVIQARYLYGPTGLVKELQNNRYYCQDGSGSTALLADSTGHLLEWYRYDLQGAPFVYAPNDTRRNPNQSGFGVRHLFTGQQWYQDIGLYDLRNRFYSPDLGRFLQPDPIGFRGGNNLYRYCGNNPVMRWDRFGLQDAVAPTLSEGWTATVEVTGSNVLEPIDPGGTGAPSGGGGGGGGGEPGGRGGSTKLTGINFSYGKPPQNSNSPQQQPPGIMVGFDIYRPTTTAEFIIAGNIIEHGDTTDTTVPIDPIEILSGGIAGLTRGFVRTAAPAAQQRTITVLGSRRAIEAGAYVTRPRFNVFRPAANMTKQEIDRANAEWLNAALVRGDEIWLVTHPERHARFLQSLPPGAFESSNYIHLELPMLEHYKAVESIIAY